MLRNCKVARVLPRIADCAKNDRSAVLRARYGLYVPRVKGDILLLIFLPNLMLQML